MDQTQLAIDFYRQQADLLRAHMNDFSEADMLVRPVAEANHAAWQVGHLAYSLVALINAVAPGAIDGLPADFVQRHSPDGAKLNEGFDSKDQLLDRFDQVNEQVIKWVQSVSHADYGKPTPQRIQGFAATIGHLIFALPPHTMLHLGQIQVIRRALAKPRLM